MPFAVLISLLWGMLAQVMGSLVGRVLLALSISFITYQGLDVGLAAIKATIVSGMQGVGGDAVRFLAYMNVDRGIALVLSAVTASLALQATGGAITRMVVKR